MQRREFCNLLTELLERSGYSLTTEETQYPTYGNMYSQVCYHTPKEMLEVVDCMNVIADWFNNNNIENAD